MVIVIISFIFKVVLYFDFIDVIFICKFFIIDINVVWFCVFVFVV